MCELLGLSSNAPATVNFSLPKLAEHGAVAGTYADGWGVGARRRPLKICVGLQVAFYKPQGNLNKHAGYADMLTGDQHIADVIAHLQKSPQWPRMLVIITYDENGGFWDHVAPPKGDRWGPGTRVPTLIVSPVAKKGFVDHTQYDTTSILRFITKRFALPTLPGLRARDEALAANGSRPMGDLTNALDLSQR